MKTERIYEALRCEEIFESYKLLKKPEKKKFSFRFAGCRPINLRGRKNRFVQPIIESNVIQKPLDFYNNSIVIGKRKLLKPVTNIPKKNFFVNYHLAVF